jgi:hypothetical protein
MTLLPELGYGLQNGKKLTDKPQYFVLMQEILNIYYITNNFMLFI